MWELLKILPGFTLDCCTTEPRQWKIRKVFQAFLTAGGNWTWMHLEYDPACWWGLWRCWAELEKDQMGWCFLSNNLLALGPAPWRRALSSQTFFQGPATRAFVAVPMASSELFFPLLCSYLPLLKQYPSEISGLTLPLIRLTEGFLFKQMPLPKTYPLYYSSTLRLLDLF